MVLVPINKALMKTKGDDTCTVVSMFTMQNLADQMWTGSWGLLTAGVCFWFCHSHCGQVPWKVRREAGRGDSFGSAWVRVRVYHCPLLDTVLTASQVIPKLFLYSLVPTPRVCKEKSPLYRASQPIWGHFFSFQILGSQRKFYCLPASAPHLLLTNIESGQVLIFLLFSGGTHQSFCITGESISNKNKGWKLQSPLEKLTLCIFGVRKTIKSKSSHKHSNRVIRKVNKPRMWLSRDEMKSSMEVQWKGAPRCSPTLEEDTRSSNTEWEWDDKQIKCEDKGTLHSRDSAAGHAGMNFRTLKALLSWETWGV